MDYLWIIYGLSMDYIWIKYNDYIYIYGLYMDYIWIIYALYGLYMVNLWIIYGQSMDMVGGIPTPLKNMSQLG